MALAARGLRETDAGTEAVTDPTDLARHRATSRRIYLASLGAAAAGVLLAWLRASI
ncbi:MAG: hypothetical protein AB7T63_16805 [Planctomycetota bacterium]